MIRGIIQGLIQIICGSGIGALLRPPSIIPGEKRLVFIFLLVILAINTYIWGYLSGKERYIRRISC